MDDNSLDWHEEAAVVPSQSGCIDDDASGPAVCQPSQDQDEDDSILRDNQYLFNKSLNSMVPSILWDYLDDKPAILFCHTKKEMEILALDLTNWGLSHASPDDIRTLAIAAKKASTSMLQKCLRAGTAYHHAALELNSVPEEHHVRGSKCEDVWVRIECH